MEKNVFRFKRFSVSHGESSMKVGVDAVLLGAWTKKETPGSILDVGTGCGVIALMLKQRYPDAEVVGVDIDEKSVAEAGFNFQNSGFDGALEAKIMQFPSDIIDSGEKYDLIVSNPPYFQAGVQNPVTPRERARHQDLLSVFTLIGHAPAILNPKGVLSMIFPTEFYERIVVDAEHKGLWVKRVCRIRNNDNRPEKRTMIELLFDPNGEETEPEYESLTLFEGCEPTLKYRNLCKDFYLKF